MVAVVEGTPPTTGKRAHRRLAPPPAPPPPKSWRKRHPVLARVCLYGALLAYLAVIVPVWVERTAKDEEDRQTGLLTTVDAVQQVLSSVDPTSALTKIREEVLSQRPNASVRREARFVEAELLDRLRLYDESDAVYQAIESEWPSTSPRGPLLVPWANMRISAGRIEEARLMLAVPHADEGYSAKDAAMVRARLDPNAKPASSAPATKPAAAAPAPR